MKADKLKDMMRLLQYNEDSNTLNDFYGELIFNKIEGEEKYICLQKYVQEMNNLIKAGKLRKDLLFICLLANENSDLLEEFVKQGGPNLLEFKEPISIYDYCILKNQHWFSEIIFNENKLQSCLSENISNKTNLLKVVNLTNKEISLSELKKFKNLNIFTNENNKFFRLYCEIVTRAVNITEFLTFVHEEIDLSKLFLLACQKSILRTISTCVDLRRPEIWDQLLSLLEKKYFSEIVPSTEKEKNTFILYVIVYKIFCSLRLCRSISTDVRLCKEDRITSDIEKIKQLLLGLQDISLQNEILEDIFMLLFMKFSNIKNESKISSEFYCRENEVRLLLTFLKTCIDEIKFTLSYNKDFQNTKCINKIAKDVTDAIWRFELVTSNSEDTCKSENKSLIPKMLAQPEALIHICLKQANFEKAKQVIQMFSMQESELAKEVIFAEKLCNFKLLLELTLKRKFSTKEHKSTHHLINESSISVLINEFLRLNQIPNHFNDFEKVNEHFKEQYPILKHLCSENETFMNIFDMAVTQSSCYEDSEELLNIAVSHNTLSSDVRSSYYEFCKTLLEIFRLINDNQHTYSIRDVLLNSEIELDVQKYQQELEIFSNLYDALESFSAYFRVDTKSLPREAKRSLHTTFLDIQKACLSNIVNEHHIRYFSRLLNYLKAFSKLFYVNQSTLEANKNMLLFEILKISRIGIVERLLFEKKIDPIDFEKFFTKMKLDTLYHVAANYFPKINIYHENSTYFSSLHKPDEIIFTYIQKRNWLLAFLIKNIHSIDFNAEISEVRVRNCMNIFNLERIQNVKVLFNGNETITFLHNVINRRILKQFCEDRIIKSDLEKSDHSNTISSQISANSLETGEEIMEGSLRNTDWKYLLDVVNGISEKQFQNDPELSSLRNNILFNLVTERFEPNSYKYIKNIKDDKLRCDCISINFKYWMADFCLEVMKTEVSQYKKTACSPTFDFDTWCKRIEFYSKATKELQASSWYDVFQLCEKKPEQVIKLLLDPSKIDLLLEFLGLHKLKEEIHKNFDENYFSQLFTYDVDIKKIKTIFEFLPLDYAEKLFINLLSQVRKVEHLDFLIKNLSDMGNSSEIISNIRISLKILACFNESEQEQFWCLLKEPLCIIEMLIMNTKLEKLGQVIKAIQIRGDNNSSVENILLEWIDDLLRKYAEKSLDFRVVTQSQSQHKVVETKLLESMDSLVFGVGKNYFFIPDEVPTKSEWVKNEEVSECMCCMETIFSMFNRRHHCRRCGRVVCGNCSKKRMLVATYGDIRVRVCKDCYQQTYYDSPSNNSVASVKSIECDYWFLTDDEMHNKIVREEFSFEHAPSVYLCLAILKYHSKNEKFTKFLLDQCHRLLKLLYPTQAELTQEIDYFMVINMLKSLAVAAKMQSYHSGQEGSALADRIISQADLLELLVERGCLHLIPNISSSSQISYIDTSIIRRLKDKLLENEQWNLALEVSTKAGLDNTGVFAAWGKSCLKAGCLREAREKFQRCFDKTAYYENSLDFSFSCSLNESCGSKGRLSQQSGIFHDNKPLKNPPLLNEIIQILENNDCKFDSSIHLNKTKPKRSALTSSTLSLNSNSSYALVSSQTDTAVCILSKLQNLNKIMGGNYGIQTDCNNSMKSTNSKARKPIINQTFYEECVYYLLRYGSHLSLLEFYIKHNKIEETVKHILENQLSSETFIEIYTLCLKEGNIDAFLECMSKTDSTLDVWKDYLRHICRYFEQQSMLHSLYQLQQFMGDYIRAAMTSIRFYKDESRSYRELKSKIGFLQKAEEHLKQELEQEQWVEVATVRRSSENSQDSFEAKSITNPSLVMKMDSKSINKHIHTIWRQMEVTNFLAQCECNGFEVMKLLPDILPFANKEMNEAIVTIPTLFGSYYEKVQLAVLCLTCGNSVEDGFKIAFRIIQEYKLNPVKVYCQAGKQFAKTENYSGLAQLVNCIQTSGTNDASIADMCDEMLILAIQTLTKNNVAGSQIEELIKFITDRSAKISAYIETKQLKSAYLLAVKYRRTGDIRRILREAEYLNQPNIKILCQRFLQASSHFPSSLKD